MLHCVGSRNPPITCCREPHQQPVTRPSDGSGARPRPAQRPARSTTLLLKPKFPSLAPVTDRRNAVQTNGHPAECRQVAPVVDCVVSGTKIPVKDREHAEPSTEKISSTRDCENDHEQDPGSTRVLRRRPTRSATFHIHPEEEVRSEAENNKAVNSENISTQRTAPLLKPVSSQRHSTGQVPEPCRIPLPILKPLESASSELLRASALHRGRRKARMGSTEDFNLNPLPVKNAVVNSTIVSPLLQRRFQVANCRPQLLEKSANTPRMGQSPTNHVNNNHDPTHANCASAERRPNGPLRDRRAEPQCDQRFNISSDEISSSDMSVGESEASSPQRRPAASAPPIGKASPLRTAAGSSQRTNSASPRKSVSGSPLKLALSRKNDGKSSRYSPSRIKYDIT